MADWRDAVAEVERAVADRLAALDRLDLPADESPVTPPPPDGFAAALAAVTRSVEEAERLVAEQEARWRDWRARLQSGTGSPAES